MEIEKGKHLVHKQHTLTPKHAHKNAVYMEIFTLKQTHPKTIRLKSYFELDII